MIQIAHNQERDNRNSDLACYVLDQLPENCRISQDEIKWSDVCGAYLEGEPTNQSVLAAMEKAFQIHASAFHILLIDAINCDTKCEAEG